MLISQYKITIKEELKFAGETFEERKSRILSTRRSATLMYVFDNNKTSPFFFRVRIDFKKWIFSYLGLFIFL